MSYTFLDLQTEVKARGILNQSGTEFDTQVKNAINTSIFRLSREALWRVLRRTTTFSTVADYTTGTGAVSVTNNSSSVTVTGATFLTDSVYTGRRVTLGGSSLVYKIATITGETTFTVDVAYDGTTSTTQSYRIYGQEEYNLPIQVGRIALLWHEAYNCPFVMRYITDQDFFESGVTVEDRNTPTHWRQWGVNDVISQPRQAGVVRVYSSSSSDTSKNITVWGTVSGYPDFETITTNASNGTTAVSGSKSFSKVERVTKDSSTVGRITVDADSANTTVAVLPVGDETGSVEYKKVQLWPLPTRIFPVNVWYYKDPWRLVNSNDIHELGYQFDEAITLLATSKVLYSQGKVDQGDKSFALYKDEMKSLKGANADTIANWKPTLRRARSSQMQNQSQVHKYLSYTNVGGSYGPLWH